MTTKEMKRQAIDDMTAINPVTDLPKHIYEYRHKQCKRSAIRGTFQMKGRKYHTKAYYYFPDDESYNMQDAIADCRIELEELKQSVGWYQFVTDKQFHGRRSTTSIITSETSYNNRNNISDAEGVEHSRNVYGTI